MEGGESDGPAMIQRDEAEVIGRYLKHRGFTLEQYHSFNRGQACACAKTKFGKVATYILYPPAFALDADGGETA